MWSPSPDEWNRIEPLVDQLLELDRSERRAFIDRSFSASPEIKAWVERLLDGADDEEFLAAVNPSIVSGALGARDDAPTAAGATFGPFRIVRELGRGGMGQVFLAERAHGTFAQRVALKVVSGAIVSESMRRRFLAEQQALARLEHPNVARLVDGGIRADGLPWFAMEYVDGKRIDEWCDARKLDVPARLRLFLAVCEAVQAAHQRLVIHRDLKPSNILVTDEGAVRLLDFGVAKLLESAPDELAEVTRADERMFTPEYAAPEQWRHEPTTTATDCYALGVILYQLVAGARPHDLHARPRVEWQRIVDEERPRAPSAVITEEAALARGTTRERLVRALQGDLDAITLTALRNDPARRYPTARQLADDVHRHLDGRPVTAREDRWTYRASRFIRRNRLKVTASSIVLVALGVGAIGITWQARRADRAAAEANAVATFLSGMFQEASPLQARGDSVTAGEMLQRATAGIDSMFPQQPDLRIRLLLLIAEINRELGSIERADTAVQRAVAVADSFSSNTLSAVGARAMLGEVARIRGDLGRADTLMRESIALAQRLDAPDTSMARLSAALGHILYRMGKYGAADSAYRFALANGQALGPLFTGTTLGNIGVALDAAGRDVEADSFFIRAFTYYRGANLTTHPDYLQAVGNRAALLEERWELDSSRVLKEELLPLLQRIHPDGHDRVIIATNNLANSWLLLNQFAKAESGFASALALGRRLHGPAHSLSIVPLNNVARSRLLDGRAAAAESTYREALAHTRSGLGPRHQTASQSWLGIGRALGAQGRHVEALAAFDSSLAIATEVLPPTHPRVSDIALARGEVLIAAGRPAEAERVLRPALSWRREHASALDPIVGESAWLVARAVVARAGDGITAAERAEVESLGAEAERRYGAIPSRAAKRDEVRSTLARWKEAWSRGR